jgi:hypothetical protein
MHMTREAQFEMNPSMTWFRHFYQTEPMMLLTHDNEDDDDYYRQEVRTWQTMKRVLHEDSDEELEPLTRSEESFYISLMSEKEELRRYDDETIALLAAHLRINSQNNLLKRVRQAIAVPVRPMTEFEKSMDPVELARCKALWPDSIQRSSPISEDVVFALSRGILCRSNIPLISEHDAIRIASAHGVECETKSRAVQEVMHAQMKMLRGINRKQWKADRNDKNKDSVLLLWQDNTDAEYDH